SDRPQEKGPVVAAIELDDVVKRYPDGFEAVKDMNLDIQDGEFMILVGPSGCGKSTALRMIAGLEDVTEKRLRIGGKIVNEVEAKDRDVAMVFQNYALYPHMTVQENIGFTLKMRKTSKKKIKNHINNITQILNLKPHLKHKPANLSGSQRQRITINHAIV